MKLLLWLILGAFLVFGAIQNANAQNTLNQSTQLTAFFNGTQSITRAFPAVSRKSIYLTAIVASGTIGGVLTLSTGTGTNCGTNTTVLYTETVIAGTPLNHGDGSAAIAVIPTALDLCITVATQSLSGWVSIAQF